MGLIMVFLIIILVCGIALSIVGAILSINDNSNFKKDNCWLIGSVAGAIIGVSSILILSETRDYDFQTTTKPQIDTVITYHSIDQVIDTTYFYKFE